MSAKGKRIAIAKLVSSSLSGCKINYKIMIELTKLRVDLLESIDHNHFKDDGTMNLAGHRYCRSYYGGVYVTAKPHPLAFDSLARLRFNMDECNLSDDNEATLWEAK